MIKDVTEPGSWQEILGRIRAGDDPGLTRVLRTLDDPARRAVAKLLSAHLAEQVQADFEASRQVRRRARGYRLAGAACLAGAEQVAVWLNRRELHRVDEPEDDTAALMSVLRRRPPEWRRDLAARLIRRLRPERGSVWSQARMPAWDLAAALVLDTGMEPPGDDAFVSGWVVRLVWRNQRDDRARPLLANDPLLDGLLPHLFQAQGVSATLAWDQIAARDKTLVGELAGLAAQGRVPRERLLDGCARWFLAGGDTKEAGPFVTLWRELRPTPAEIPVVDFVRLLPSASSAVVDLATAELRRADAAGALDAELFAEAVQALAFRPERKHLTVAVRWIAEAPPVRAGGVGAALAAIFDGGAPALRGRAVRLAVELAPHLDADGVGDVREAATRLPGDLRALLAGAFGEVAAEEEPVVVPVLSVVPLPSLPPEIDSAGELAAELEAMGWPLRWQESERLLAGLVALSHHDRDGLAKALSGWRDGFWLPYRHTYAYGEPDGDVHTLLAHCALAIIDPGASRDLSKAADLARESHHHTPLAPPQRFVARRFRELIAHFERGETLPALLSTPTAPTGHVDAQTLVERMERFGAHEPPVADLEQALLRLPRHTDPAVIERAEKLPAQAGARLATWLRDGGLPEPDVRWHVEDTLAPYRGGSTAAYAEVVPPESPHLSESLRELFTVTARTRYPRYSRDLDWWPAVLPAHREVAAAHLLKCLHARIDSTDGAAEVVAALVHGDGPAGAATAGAIAVGMGHRVPAQRACAADALLTLAARDQLPAADLGRALARLVRTDQVKLNRITGVLNEVTSAGAHRQVWATLAEAVPLLRPEPGERVRTGLGDLLAVAVRAAGLADARGELPGLAELAARKGSSLVLHAARSLHRQLSAP